MVDQIVLGLVGITPARETGGIDHQSKISLPKGRESTLIDIDFWTEFSQFVMQKDLVILGGNDNDYDHPLLNGEEFALPIRTDTRDLPICRKDKGYGFWTLFSPISGTKIRFSFDDYGSKDEPEMPERASTPELVDLKITDYCTKGCSFCFEDSSVSGAHADYMAIYQVLSALSDVEVFAVANGGGEPTKHPNFAEILAWARSAGIVPNFSTASLDWMRDRRMLDQVLANVGGFAYSVQGKGDVREFGVLVESVMPGSRHKASVQFIPELQPKWVIEGVLREAAHWGLKTTLLGLKLNGRAETECAGRIGDAAWVNVVNELMDECVFPELGADTVLASRFKADFEKFSIPAEMYETRDGRFSMYIDLVKRQMGPSSYCAASERVALPDTYMDKAIGEAFRSFP